MAFFSSYINFEFINNLDSKILLFIQNFIRNDFGDWFFPFYTDIHKQQWFILSFIIPILALWIFKLKKNKMGHLYYFVINILLVDALCGQIIKKAFARERPFVTFNSIEPLSPASGFSFVSNHAANSMAMATALILIYPNSKCLKYIVFSFAILTCFSRAYNGVHFITDIVAGAAVGYLLSRLSFSVYQKKFLLRK